MKKRINIFLILIISFFTMTNSVNAEDFNFDFKTSGKAKSSSITSKGATHLKTNITRGNSSGLRITLYEKITEEKYSINKGPEDINIIDNKADIKGVATVNIKTEDNDFINLTEWIKDANAELAKIKKIRYEGNAINFFNDLDKSKAYKLLSKLNTDYELLPRCGKKNTDNCIPMKINKDTPVTKAYNSKSKSNKGTAEWLQNNLKNMYITFEPILEIYVPDKINNDISDYQYDVIYSIGKLNSTTLKNEIDSLAFDRNEAGYLLTYTKNESETKFKEYCNNDSKCVEKLKETRDRLIKIFEIGTQYTGDLLPHVISWSNAPFYSIEGLVKKWNEQYDNLPSSKREKKSMTVKDLADYLLNKENKELSCITITDDNKNRCGWEGGSVKNKYADISYYLYSDKKIGQWEKVSGRANSWDAITNKSGYGIAIIWMELEIPDDLYNNQCTYDEETNTLILSNGDKITKDTNNLERYNKECCDYNVSTWGYGTDYDKFQKSNLYKKYCTSPCTIEHYKALKVLSNSIIIEDNKIKSFDIPSNIVPPKCCNYDEYESDELKGITKNEFNSNVAKACNFCNKDINSATKLSDVMYNIPNTKESLNCCYWENFGLSDDRRKENSGLSKTKFNNVVKNKKFCQDYCTFDKSLGKGERYYNGLDCCKWTNYGKAGDAEETRKLRIQNAGNRTMTELKNTEEYKLICPTANDFCEFDYDNNKLILNGNETNDCCESPDLWKSQTEYDKFRKYDNGKYYNQFCKTEKNYCTALKIRDENRLECCDDLSQYSESVQQTIKINYGSLENYLKTEYNQIYYQYCPTNDDGCNPHIESSCPNCDTNHNGLTYDSVKNIDSTDLNISDEAKKCIFDNDDYEYEELSNKYCSIYCTQKIEYNYPSKIMPTGGRYITVGENGSFSPIKNITSMTCRISKVDTKTFEKDLKNAEKELKEAYNEYSKNAEPIENKEEIINTENGSEKLNNVAENVCDCKNNVTGLSSKDNKCCESTANETLSGSQVSSVKKIYAQVIDAKEKPAPSDKNSCNSANGSWITTKKVPYSSYDVSAGTLTACGKACGDASNRENFIAYCKDGYEAGSKPKCDSHGGMISSKCTCKGGTKTEELDNPYCANYRKQYYCEDGYTLSGTKCIPDMPSNLECERDSAGNVKCNYYSCDSTINVGNEKGYLSSSKEGYVSQKDAKCTYKYCKTRNYLKYDYQTYNKYSYGESKKLTQKANNVKTCSNNDDYYETVFKRQKQIALQKLMAAEKKYNEIVKNYKSCFSIDEKMGDYLNYDIKVKLDYNNAGIYTVNQELKRTETNSTDQDYIKIKKDYEIAYLDYGNNYEFKTKKQEFMIFENMNRINSVKKTKTYNYKLSSDTYLYVGKDSWSKTSSEINSIYIGNHLPVAYNPHNDSETTLTLTTTYDEGKIKNSSFANALCKDEYMCKLTVNDNSGCIIPVYRPISLKDPFPDQDGTGRQTGINWCYGNNCANTNETVKSVITNNRTVKEDSVYNLIPLYTITLKPGDIKEIRNYNATTTYGDYDLLCENNTGKFCKSRFLRGDSVALEGEEGRYNISHLINQNRSCALNESLQGCIPGDYYDTGGGN